MPGRSIDELLENLHSLEAEVESAIENRLKEKQREFRYRVDRQKVRFEAGVHALQRKYRIGLWKFLREARISHVLTAPFIYFVFFPFVFLDLAVTVYQHICFRVYGIPLVRRKDHIVIDRHQLAYLNAIEKINCVYCGYGNGLIEYVREISSRTEQYWCPIKHGRRTADPHHRMEAFVDFGDADGYQGRLRELREALKELQQSDT